MDTRSAGKTKRLATISLILGILSLGLDIVALIPIIYARLTGGPDAWMFALGFLALFLMLGGLIIGIPGCITAIIAVKRNKREDGERKIKRLANIGVVLSILGIAPVLILFASALLFPSGPVAGPQTLTPFPGPQLP